MPFPSKIYVLNSINTSWRDSILLKRVVLVAHYRYSTPMLCCSKMMVMFFPTCINRLMGSITLV